MLGNNCNPWRGEGWGMEFRDLAVEVPSKPDGDISYAMASVCAASSRPFADPSRQSILPKEYYPDRENKLSRALRRRECHVCGHVP